VPQRSRAFATEVLRRRRDRVDLDPGGGRVARTSRTNQLDSQPLGLLEDRPAELIAAGPFIGAPRRPEVDFHRNLHAALPQATDVDLGLLRVKPRCEASGSGGPSPGLRRSRLSSIATRNANIQK